jgi:hypothetical protein
MKLDPGMHIGMHLVFFGKSGVTAREVPTGANGSARRRFWSQPEVEDDSDFGSHTPVVEGGNEWDKAGAKMFFHLRWRRNG